MIDQIRSLQEKHGQLWLELSGGRIIQADACQIATHKSDSASVAVLYSDGCFEVINPALIVAVGPGIHQTIQAARKARFEEVRKRLEEN